MVDAYALLLKNSVGARCGDAEKTYLCKNKIDKIRLWLKKKK